MMCQWKELPDWTNSDCYMFMKDATVSEWAWEFLRRIPEFEQDCKKYSKVIEVSQSTGIANWSKSDWAKIHVPERNPGETEYQWLQRTALLEGPEPRQIPAKEFFARKWSLKTMVSWDRPFGPDISFRTAGCEFPFLIRDEDELAQFTKTSEIIYEDAIYGHQYTSVAKDKAVIAFDLQRPLGPQRKAAKLLLDQQYKRMKQEKIGRVQTPKLKTDVLTRHLQVLDAKRSDPEVKLEKIATALGYLYSSFDKDTTPKTPTQQGSRWLRQAQIARNQYLNFVINAEVPSENGN